MVYRTLILLAEAPDPAKADPTKVKTDPPADPAKTAPKVKADPSADPAADDADGGTPPDDDTSVDDADMGDDAGGIDDGGDDDDDPLDDGVAPTVDAIDEELRRGQLYDAVVEVHAQCKALSDTARTVSERVKDEAVSLYITRAKRLIDDTADQCDILRSRFADLGYDRVRDLYTTVRERVSAVAEIIKHVIDGDDDFRQPGSETSSGKTPAKD